MTKPNLYDVLGVPRTASPADIKKAFRKLARKFHPDRNPGDPDAVAKFQTVQTAWEVLGDAEHRAKYDATGEFDLRADDGFAPVLAMLSDAMAVALNELIEGGEDPRQADMIAILKTTIANRREELKKGMLLLQKGKTVLADMVERFTVEDGNNELQAVARGHLARSEQKLQQLETELSHLQKGLAFLKKCRYKRDKSGIDQWDASWMKVTINVGGFTK